MVPQSDVTPEMILSGLIEGERTVMITKVRVAAFCDRILLEDM